MKSILVSVKSQADQRSGIGGGFRESFDPTIDKNFFTAYRSLDAISFTTQRSTFLDLSCGGSLFTYSQMMQFFSLNSEIMIGFGSIITRVGF
jgi:hypothetical protein